MAAISRIQVSNYLTEGYSAGKEWSPLYRGETFRLFGHPTAMQIDNGGGKTSLTEAWLYTLTRHRRLKDKVLDRVSPADKGWTHIRFEFVERSHEEDILQTDLITLSPEDILGITYVVGMCWSRGKEPNFYSYQGLLEDAPCFKRESNGLVLIANEIFRKSIENMPRAKWNRWRSQTEWLEEIKQFTNVDVLLQNVEFQLEGAGDYSAIITKVKPEGNETYDTAFFRQFVAPELLKHSMGAEGEPDELGFEDTILKTLRPAADALLDINRRQVELEETKEALQKFKPVLDKAREAVVANEDYEREMSALAQNAAIVHALAVSSPMPGMPVVPPGTLWASDKRVLAALEHMVIDKKNGVAITDEGLVALIEIETGRINQYAKERRIKPLDADLHGIELRSVFKNARGKSQTEPDDGEQHIENKDVIKFAGHGGRRKAVLCYGLESALSLVSATSNLAGAKTSGLSDVLTRAFGIAVDEIDTNPYRRQLRRLGAELAQKKVIQKEAQGDYARHHRDHDTLTKEGREAEENQIAYEGFMARKGEFPEAYWASPAKAHTWAKEDARQVEAGRTEHVRLSSERKDGYALWQALTEKHGLVPLPDVLEDLNSRHSEAKEINANARRALDDATASLRTTRAELGQENAKLNNAQKRLTKLEDLAAGMATFREVFGNADPKTLDPQGDLKIKQEAWQKNDRLLQDAYTKKQALLDLVPKTRLYGEIFGGANPNRLDPSTDLKKLLEEIGVEEGLITEHQFLVESLSLFRESHPGISPDEWLDQTAKNRQDLTREKNGNVLRIGELEGELNDLDAFGAADDRVYAKALKLLDENGIVFDRLHDLASRTVQGSKLEQCLTLFSAFLSAPVVDLTETASIAARLLEESRLTVPIFLKSALVAFLEGGDIRQTGDVAHAIWAGCRTRQVSVLLNPSLIEDEKTRIQAEIGALRERNESIQGDLDAISEGSPAVRTALNAKDASRRDSERIHTEASKRRDTLQLQSEMFERRASLDAQEAISAMKHYIKQGGENRYCELVENEIPDLEGKRDQIKASLDSVAKQTTENALRALHAAKDYQCEGGDDAHETAKTECGRLDGQVLALGQTIEDIEAKVEGSLTEAAKLAEAALGQINQTYALDKRDLEASVNFEAQGYVAFMEQAPSRQLKFDQELQTAQTRLQGIDFERADRYTVSARTQGRSLADRIAEALEKKNKAGAAIDKVTGEITQLEAAMTDIVPFMEAMHQMVASIRTQYNKMSLFSGDILRHMPASPFSDPEILGYSEAIRTACVGEIPNTVQDTKIAMLNLRQCIDDLEINSDELRRQSENKRRRLADYVQSRDEFCERARKGEIRGLNQLEISAIEEARTIEQLQHIEYTQDTIQAQLVEGESHLEKIRQTMEANKKASIANLTRFGQDAQLNLNILDRVMKKTPNARFHIEAPVADEKEIEEIITELLGKIENKERTVRESGVALLNDEIERKAEDHKRLIHDTIYKRIFSTRDPDKNPIVPRVYFTHVSIRGKDKVPFTNRGLSTGQQTALAMMWLIKQTEFAIARAAALYGSAKERKAALKGAQRIMLFDGLFSNLSNEAYINDAFQGLRGVGENFQLIGLIHNPYYVNNNEIFPVHLVGKKKLANKGDAGRQRVFVSVEESQDTNGMIFYTSAYKHNSTVAEPVRADA